MNLKMENLRSINWLGFAILALCSSCQQNEAVVQPENHQDFSILCDRDTTLVSEQGVRIKVEANTFSCGEGKLVKIRFAAIMSKMDMVLNRFYTVDEQGNLLETGGMFQIEDLTNGTEIFKKPILLEIPADPKYLNFDMMEYQLTEMEGGRFAWTQSPNFVEVKKNGSRINGKELFKQHCSSCHNKNLRDMMTGPPLGNVHLYRSKQWLRDYTKDSQALIAKGDTLAICLWNNWNRSMMSSFNELSDAEIDEIYDYIAAKSRSLDIAKDEINYTTTCDVTLAISRGNNFDTTGFYLLDTNSVEYNYRLSIKDKNWVNVDIFFYSKNAIEPVVVELDQPCNNPTLAMVFEDRNIVIPFQQDLKESNKYILLNSFGKTRIELPIGEKTVIVAYCEAPEFEYKLFQYTTRKTGNNIKLKLDSNDKQQFLDKLKGL